MDEELLACRLEEDPTGGAPLLLGLLADLHGHTLHADVCRAVLDPALNEDPESIPHPELNANHPEAGTVLHWAAAQRLHQAALAILACGQFRLSSASRSCDGSTALHVAGAEGAADVVRALLAHRDFKAVAQVDRDGFTALHGAAFCGHLECVQLLLANREGLVAAAAEGSFDIPRLPGHWAAEAVTLCDLRTALHMAAVKGHAAICEELLALPPPGVACGANVLNRVGASALHMAARGCHTATCSSLLSKTSGFSAVNAKDVRGFTALHWAAQQASGDICALILQREDFARVEDKDLRSRTALQIAEAKGYQEVRRLILLRLGPAGRAP